VRKNRLLASVIATCAVCFGALAIVLGLGWSPKLGLDLQGGLSAVYAPAPPPGHTVTTAELNTAVSIMRLRILAINDLSSPQIDVVGNNIVVQIPGAKHPQATLAAIGSTAQLYFRPVLCLAPPYNPPRDKHGNVISKPYVTPPNCGAQYLWSANHSVNAPDPALASYRSASTIDGTNDPAKRVILPQQGAGGERMLVGPMVVTSAGPANGSIISSAYSQYQPTASPPGWTVQFTLTSKGTTIFNEMAAQYYQAWIADDLDAQIITAPQIQSKNFPGSGQITGNFSPAQASSIALDLNYGALPVPLKPVTIQTVSPSLGKSSLRAGLIAGIIGLILVMGYGIFYYRGLGLVVVLGLVTTFALLYAIICALGHTSLGLDLDLAGITGLIVSIGITVDSYIVFFERLKDEIRAGRTVRASVDRGFKSAYRTILSADAVSLLGALVLWFLSIGAVRGFAFFLGLSTIVDMITAYTFTRPLVILLGQNPRFTEARGIGIGRGLNVAPEPAV
jgi:preprotein translocase subunit SecD